MLHHIRQLLCCTLVLLLSTVVVPSAVAQEESGQESQEPDVAIEEPDVVMHVSGLSCSMCVRSVTKALRKVEAVEEIQVLLDDDQRILLTLKEGKEVEEKVLREAVESAGFSTRKVVFAGAGTST